MQEQRIKIQGFSLVEMLVVMLLSLLVLLGFWEVYQTQRSTYYYGKSLMLIQENAHLATAIFRNAIQHAGFMGCRHLASEFTIFSLLQSLRGYNAMTGIPIQLATLSNLMLLSDILQLTQMNTRNASLVKQINNYSMEVESTPSFKSGDLIIAADCEKGELFQIKKTTYSSEHQKIYSSTSLNNYHTGTQIGHLISDTFFIADTGRKNQHKVPIYSLYKQDQQGVRHELLEGVAGMRIYYGIEEKQGIIHYYSAHQVSNWDRVRTVKVLLLLTGIEEVLQKPQLVRFDNDSWMQNNRQLYQTWIITVFLRQRYV